MEKLDSYRLSAVNLTAPAIAVMGAVMLLLGYTSSAVRLAAGNPVWS